jgi:lysophospholipase L1-like esterase
MKAPSNRFRSSVVLAFAAVAATMQLAPARAEGAAPVAACNAPGELIRLMHPLKRVAQRVAAGQPVTIVAIGSSSTAGAGASSPDKCYPSQLQAELKKLFPRIDITVINRGVNGEEARDMLDRFDRDVFASKPDLVLWQVGSNAVLRDRPIDSSGTLLHDGIKRLKAAGTDVVLINPQYSPKVITKHDVEGMVALIEMTAKETNVDLFQRFAMMRYWQLTEGMPFSAFVSQDGLHMNDWSYGCLAKMIALAIHEAATRSTVTATARSR